ncbi:putative nonsense-mediated mRNA decay protein Upf3 [Aspergillus chevalieri]|uniref:RRM domain-containing protein n=1 Tax=Aspergillus chevalieri TaxID=182096 RepID=A0A7R7VU56_ASPCH|nr:uncharacterized protein ACHE_60030A [Aspergillus chevalieri]BCR90144.1 hypothetical protein ACHE_60030A [Aspergillus chevalieri]
MTQIKSTGGVLPIPAAATQKNAPAKKAPKPPAPRLKLLIRRLPPGLTEEEFRHAVGEAWMAGAGKVDWFQYRPGKVSKDPAKPSRPSRAYIHVISSDHIAPLADKVRQSSFLDAQNTANDPVLLGPPSVEFAPYAKIPGNRVRKDARQGTIDQDPDFFAFLESLTQPITKPSAESVEPEEKKETMTTTPLVQYIKDKKANKAKEQTAAKSSRKSEKEAKLEKVQAKKLLQRPDRETAPVTEKMEKKSKSDKATKEAVKAANKAANVAAKQSGRATPTGKETPTAPASERKRERGNAAAAAKILQRDLGLSSSGGHRKGGKGGSEADAKKENVPNAPTEPSKKETAKPPKQPKGKASETTPQPSEPSTPQPQPTPPPSALAASKPPKPSKGKQPAASPSATATQAFLKHANPSQGVTELLLETAFSPFGQVVSVEIDKKKGFGYVDFAEPSGLQKAIAASPVTVAQSQVVVLERKTNPGGDKSRKGRGGAAGGEQAAANSGNGNNNSSARGGKPEGSGGGGSSRGRGGRGRNRGGNKPEKERA